MRLTRVLVKSRHFGMSALPLKADMVQHDRDVRFVPKADVSNRSKAGSYSITSSAVLSNDGARKGSSY
jgi:hypothetical protein